MTTAAAIELDFDEGIDRKTLRQLCDRFLAVNEARLERTRTALGPRQRVVPDLLPLVFHLNHPALPGYLDGHCPQGIAHYEPSRAVLHAARREARSFRMRSSGRRAADIEGLFFMGSPGSLGHSVASDLDVWLCHRPDLSGTDVRRLERKAEAVSVWAARLGVELNIFVFTAEAFRRGRQEAAVTGENCGSAQHFLLLDEFYRTGVYLAGCYPLWWLIPSEFEARYKALARQLYEYRFIRADRFIDFGPVPRIPAAEFLGAGVWQLYKGIDSPWKSILKLLLIECYARDRQGGLLSLQFKSLIFMGVTDPDRLDPYVLLYERLASWLDTIAAPRRLDLVRRALYLKSGVPLSRLESVGAHWQGRLLQSLVAHWGWDEADVRDLDNRQAWQASDVQALRRRVVSELTHSYRFLSRLARHHSVHAAIRPEDMQRLGRKLYAAFQRKAGKVERINPNLAPSLAEENLSFHHRSAQPGTGLGWTLYRDLDQPSDVTWQAPIRRTANLVELMVWSHYNGLLTRGTRLNLQAGRSGVTLAALRGISETLFSRLPVPSGPASGEALMERPRLLTVLLFVNVAEDPQSHLRSQGLHKLSSRHDSLDFSATHDNLVMALDQVTLNSWHELSVHRYEAGDVLVQCLKNLLAARVIAPAHEPELTVDCQTPGHGSAIESRLRQLFADVQKHFFAGGRGPHPLRYIIEMGQRFFLLHFNNDQPAFATLESPAALLDYLEKPQSRFIPVVPDRYALDDNPALRKVLLAAQPDNIQVFFRQTDTRVDVWVVDELGSLSHWQQPPSSRNQAMSPLLRFLANLSERRQLRRALTEEAADLSIACRELVYARGEWRTEDRSRLWDEQPLDGFEVMAMGVQEGDEPLQFDLFCEEQEFSVLEYGDQLIPAVAHYIRSRRSSGARYPVYLTDLHLPHDLDPYAYRHDLQTCQYLHYRNRIQAALNSAL
ncbi:adenylate cyclase [Tamilnaduibacter salinus]|uniref:Adenylate cyclase n=1 Tax=Tamilnaduibacter salinus TaxID=1484056 RepID=A0A2U1CXH8_9GAMM|nr:class I adenylate cyclase [Tamilnaduibacter salinus]PVY76929.1 adenylate cyclase [Tamilnaduibacter salinus]